MSFPRRVLHVKTKVEYIYNISIEPNSYGKAGLVAFGAP